MNGKWSHTRCGRCGLVEINLFWFHCSQKARHKEFILAYEISYNQAIFHELQEVRWCEEVGVIFWELPKELESNAPLIHKLSPFSSYGCLGLWAMPELVVVFNQLRDFIQKDLRINKHYVW